MLDKNRLMLIPSWVEADSFPGHPVVPTAPQQGGGTTMFLKYLPGFTSESIAKQLGDAAKRQIGDPGHRREDDGCVDSDTTPQID